MRPTTPAPLTRDSVSPRDWDPPTAADVSRTVRQRQAASREQRRKVPRSACETVLGQTNRRRCGSSCSPTSVSSNRRDEAADWVHKNLAAKNTLIAADADSVEASFRERLATIESASPLAMKNRSPRRRKNLLLQLEKPFLAPTDDAAAAPIILPSSPSARRRRVAGKTIRLRDKEHCKFVASQPCVVCGRTPSEAHHIRFAQPRALGRKVSDEYTVPVCRLHHRELHSYGDEASWWAGVSIDPRVDPLPIALELWRKSRSHPR